MGARGCFCSTGGSLRPRRSCWAYITSKWKPTVGRQPPSETRCPRFAQNLAADGMILQALCMSDGKCVGPGLGLLLSSASLARTPQTQTPLNIDLKHHRPEIMVSSTTIDWASSPLGISIGVLAATYVFFWAYLHLTQDPREPPSGPLQCPHSIPRAHGRDVAAEGKVL